MQATDDVLRVPLNLDKFRRYRDMQAVTASMGAAMTLACCGFPALALYGMLTDPSSRAGWEGTLWLGLGLVWFLGCATWPAVQLANVLTCTLTQNLPALVVTREGVWDYSSNYVFGFIPWQDIEAVGPAIRRSQKLNKDFPGVAFVVKNKEVLLRRKPGLAGMWIGMDDEITDRRQILIPEGRMGLLVDDVVRLVNDFRQRQVSVTS